VSGWVVDTGGAVVGHGLTALLSTIARTRPIAIRFNLELQVLKVARWIAREEGREPIVATLVANLVSHVTKQTSYKDVHLIITARICSRSEAFFRQLWILIQICRFDKRRCICLLIHVIDQHLRA
jgi:hypothetical protein